MSYTATLTELIRKRDEWRFSILYADTETLRTFEKNYRRKSITKEGLADLARSEAASLLANESSDIDVPIGTTIDVTPVEVAPPTQAQIDKASWFNDYSQLNAMLDVVSKIPNLATNQANKAISDLQTSLEDGWLNSYLGDL